MGNEQYMTTENYEYKTVNLNKRNKGLYGFWTSRFTTRASMAMEKLAKEGWELVNTTSDFVGNPRVLTFRRAVES
jgi:hypothetical protein